MPSACRYKRSRADAAHAGFTFVEVLAALVIVSISLLALLGLHVRSMAMADTAQAASNAVFLAREKLAETASAYPEIGVRTGVAGQGAVELRWRTEVSDCELPQLIEAGVRQLRQVTVDVSWSQGLGRKNLQMSTCVPDKKLK